MKKYMLAAILFFLISHFSVQAQNDNLKLAAKTEVFTPIVPVVTPGNSCMGKPSDAIYLFNGKNLDEWVLTNDTTRQADWLVNKGAVTVKKSSGNIQTKKTFTNYQLHIEWLIPKSYANIKGTPTDFYLQKKPGDGDALNTGQLRGNSGVFLASTGGGDAGYELQVLDNYENATYVNGQAGSIYKQSAPLVNACRKPGEWQSYDIIWKAPVFNADGSLKQPAFVTVYHNGVLVQNNFALLGETVWIGEPSYKAHGSSPIKLQSHGDASEPISFRNIWVRNL
jgi:hypothetical protein